MPNACWKAGWLPQKKRNWLYIQKRSILSLLKASYVVVRRVKAFTMAEELMLPAAVDMCSKMIGEAVKKLWSSSLTSFNCWTSWTSYSKGGIAASFWLLTKSKLSNENWHCGLRGPRRRGWTCFQSWVTNLWIFDPFSVDPTPNDIVLPTDLESQPLEAAAWSCIGPV